MITILYFGRIAQITQCQSEEINWNSSVGQLHQMLCDKYPEIASIRIRYAVGKQMRNADYIITDLAEVALMPPFAGG